jgi:DNA-3-methyladenine glycosylase I
MRMIVQSAIPKRPPPTTAAVGHGVSAARSSSTMAGAEGSRSRTDSGAATVKRRCPWCGDDPLYVAYHDTEWGHPVHDDRVLFEFLVLEGAQAGLSWITILRKREHYRRALDGFDAQQIARYTPKRVQKLLKNPGIVRHRLKVESTVSNARAFLKVQEEFGSFDAYLWGFVAGKPVVNRPHSLKDVPAQNELSDRISKDLLRRGFRFVGSTIIYAYLQAVGVVNDHVKDCFLSSGNPARRPVAR